MKINEVVRLMFAEPDDMGGGDAGPLEPVQDDGQPSQGEPSAEPSQAAPAGFDPNKFAEQLAQSFAQHTAQQRQVEPTRQPTEAEMRAALKYWEPDDKWHESFGNLETQKTAVQEMIQKMYAHADTLAQARALQIQQQFEKQFSPIKQQFEQMAAQQREQRFTTKFPDLARPELRTLVTTVAQGLLSQGSNFQSEEQYFDAVAKGVNGIINPNTPTNHPTQRGNHNAFPTVSPGNGGGGGNGGGQTTSSNGIHLFGPVGKG